MATTPLFAADEKALKKRLRLSGIAKKDDITTMLQDAILVVRAGFYRALGKTRVDELVALTAADDPSTEDEHIRAIANVTEVKWVRMELMRTTPMIFADSSGSTLQVWNDEAAFREMGAGEINREVQRLDSEIKLNLEFLKGTQSAGSEATMGIITLEPEAAAASPKPGASVFPT